MSYLWILVYWSYRTILVGLFCCCLFLFSDVVCFFLFCFVLGDFRGIWMGFFWFPMFVCLLLFLFCFYYYITTHWTHFVNNYIVIGQSFYIKKKTNPKITLTVIPASAPRLVWQRPWYVLSCLWDGAYKITLAVNRKEYPMWRQRVSFLNIWVVIYHMSDAI